MLLSNAVFQATRANAIAKQREIVQDRPCICILPYFQKIKFISCHFDDRIALSLEES